MLIHKLREIYLTSRFEKTKVGQNTCAPMLETFTTLLGEKRLTNKSIRTSSIQAMRKTGASDLDIIKITGQHVNTLKHYSGGLEADKKRMLSNTISNVGAPPMTTAPLSAIPSCSSTTTKPNVDAQNASKKHLIVSKLPLELNVMETLTKYFSKFGALENVQVFQFVFEQKRVEKKIIIFYLIG